MTILNNFNKKYVLPLFCLITAVFSIFLTSCGGGGGGGIFKAISEEENLNKSTVPLNVRGLTYCGGSLYVTNGSKIFRKGAGEKRVGWSEVGGYGSNIATIASNGTDLYVMTWNKDTGVATGVSCGNSPVTGISGTIKNIFDNKVYGAGQKCYAYTSSGTYELNGTTATYVGNFISAYGSQTSGYEYYAAGQGYNHDSVINTAINGKQETITGITGMAAYGNNILVSTLSTGYYLVSNNNWESCPSEHKNSGQFSGMGAYGIWVYGNTIYIAAYTSDSKRQGLWSYYGDGDSWNME